MKKTTKGAKTSSKKKPTNKTKAKATKAKTKTKAKAKKLDKTHIIAILDNSTSMSSIIQSAISGFNEFLDGQQKVKGKATMDVILFSSHDKYTVVEEGKDIQEVKPMTSLTYVPNGNTALYDAIAKATTAYKLKHNDMKPSQRPDKVLVLIVTDGEENDSREYPRTDVDQIRNLVNKRKSENWQFLFLCSTENAALTGQALGVSAGNTLKFANTDLGNHVMYSTLSVAAANYRTTSVKSKNFNKVSENLLADADDEKNG
jgi:hypothetical protein